MLHWILIGSILLPFPAETEYPLKDGRPTSEGIERYVEEQSDHIVKEFQEFLGDTLYNVFIYADDFSGYHDFDSLELGRYYANEISISTNELFLAYELEDLDPDLRKRIRESNRFVKAAIIHELAHEYLNQIRIEMQSVDGISVHPDYQVHLWLIRSREPYGSTFIEEGICEYITEEMGQLIPPKRPFVPSTEEDLLNEDLRYHVVYKYATRFVRPLLDDMGFKRGAKVLFRNPPPSYQEILNPDLFYQRLVIDL